MKRSFYLDLAAAGQRMPIGTHLVLHEHPDAQEIVTDGEKLGRVLEETARRFHTPLAVPLMNLTLEKSALLTAAGVPVADIDTYHYNEPPSEDPRGALRRPTYRSGSTGHEHRPLFADDQADSRPDYARLSGRVGSDCR
jgi:hypothetical protein